MPTAGTHAEAKARTRKAFDLRIRGATWHEIADTLGYSGAASAHKAVTNYLRQEQPEKLSDLRKYSVRVRETVMRTMWSNVAALQKAGRYSEAIAGLKAIAEVQDKQDRVTGVALAPPTEITVNVGTGAGTAAAIIEQAEQQLLALAAATQTATPGPAALPVLDAEVIDPEEQTA